MNKNQLLLNIADDSIIFPKQTELPPQMPLPEIILPTKILPRPKPKKGEDSFSIRSVGAGPYSLLTRQKDVHIFVISISDIDRQIASNTEDSLEAIYLSNAEVAAQNLEDIRERLPIEFHEFLDIFNRAQVNNLPPYRVSDYKIKLIGDSIPPQSRAYRMSPYKIQKVKAYLDENLSKGFIIPS